MYMLYQNYLKWMIGLNSFVAVVAFNAIVSVYLLGINAIEQIQIVWNSIWIILQTEQIDLVYCNKYVTPDEYASMQ